MKRDFLDLRFIIGLFFSLSGLILFIGSFILKASSGKSEITNFWSGIFYLVFGVFMILLWFFGSKEEEKNEKKISEE